MTFPHLQLYRGAVVDLIVDFIDDAGHLGIPIIHYAFCYALSPGGQSLYQEYVQGTIPEVIAAAANTALTDCYSNQF